jgi:hypothetical protein
VGDLPTGVDPTLPSAPTLTVPTLPAPPTVVPPVEADRTPADLPGGLLPASVPLRER